MINLSLLNGMLYGAERRNKILDLMRADRDNKDSNYHPGGIAVNGMHQIRWENDPDLRHLVKKGRLKIVRKPGTKPKKTMNGYAPGLPYGTRVIVKQRNYKGQTWLELAPRK